MRKHKKTYRDGFNLGYSYGYAKGLHDGNPLVVLAESLGNVLTGITDTIKKYYPEGGNNEIQSDKV